MEVKSYPVGDKVVCSHCLKNLKDWGCLQLTDDTRLMATGKVEPRYLRGKDGCYQYKANHRKVENPAYLTEREKQAQHHPGDSWKGRSCPYGSFTCQEGFCQGCQVYQSRGKIE